MSHAILSASGSHRWLACPPSAQLEQGFPDELSPYAAEGTFAHELAELRLSRAVANTCKPSAYKRKLNELKENDWYSAEMGDHIDQYVTQISEIYLAAKKACKDALVLLEQRLDFSDWVPEGFGTGDVVIISDDAVEVIDLKYGKGVPVSAEENSQMRLYGLGALKTYGLLYDFTRIRMTIIQPRLDNISTEELSEDELLRWAREVVAPTAAQAIAGEGEFSSGEHCRFCKARFTCRARAERNLELAQYEFKNPALLIHAEIGDILTRTMELSRWASDIQNYALEKAERHGVKFPGWKLVEGRSVRKYTDEEAIAKTLMTKGYEEDAVMPRILLGITAMEKLLGKKAFAKLLLDYIEKPPGRPTLVPESDKRPEISSAQAAAVEFAEEEVPV